MENTNFELTIAPRKYWGQIFILAIVLLIFGGLNPFLFHPRQYTSITIYQIMPILFFCLFCYFFVQELAWVIAKVTVTVGSGELIITKYCWGMKFSKNYELSKISNLTAKHKVPGDTFIGSISTPPSWRINLVTDPTVLYFTYDGETNNIGPHLQDFPAEELIKEIENRKGKK